LQITNNCCKLRAIFSFFFVLILAAQVLSQSPRSTVNAREYFPGDFVHVIVDATSDTAQITATMPDNSSISLVQQRVSGIWRGIWQVPVGFKAGNYHAKLTAVDIQGNVFEGETDPFQIGELAMITLVGKPTLEAVEKPPLSEKISVTTPVSGEGPDALIKRILQVVALPTTKPAPILKAEEKKLLIEKNLSLGKENFDKRKYSVAAAYFRIVLYLSPDNKEAGLYLAQTADLLASQKEQQRRTFWLSTSAIFAVILGLSVLVWWLLKTVFVKPAPQVCEVPIPPSAKEKRDAWFKKMGWNGNPFNLDALQQLFSNGDNLELAGLSSFIRARIEAVGGKGTEPFTASALEKIYDLSKGNPKTAIKICDWALNLAIERNHDQITSELVGEYESISQHTILIVDDEEIVRTSLDVILKKGGGYATDFAVDGEEALKKIKGNKYGLVLLDIAMPKLDGYEILKQVRPIYPDLPIIFVTGKGTPQQTMVSLAQYNLSGYIEKPFTPEKILDIVARTLKSR